MRGPQGPITINAVTTITPTPTITYTLNGITQVGNPVFDTALPAGTYSFSATIAPQPGGPCAVGTFTVPGVLALTVTPTNPGATTHGSIQVSVTGGTPPITATLTPGPTLTVPANTGTVTFTGLAADTYLVTVTDASGCTKTQTVKLSCTAQLVVTSTTTPPTNGSNGSIQNSIWWTCAVHCCIKSW